MDENNENIEQEQQNVSENTNNSGKCEITDKWLKFIILSIAFLVGTFLAVYFVADQAVKQAMYMQGINPRMLEKVMRDDVRAMKKMDKGIQPLLPSKSDIYTPIANLDENDNGYKLTINLKYFGDDLDKIRLDVKPYKISVFGTYENEGQDSIHSLTYSQSFSLSEKIDPKNITKERVGDKCTVFLPFADK